MFEIIILLLIFAMIIGIALVLLVHKKHTETPPQEIDYQTFFTLGISFLPVGIIFSIIIENPGFFGISALGAIYLAIGIANRDKWNNKE